MIFHCKYMGVISDALATRVRIYSSTTQILKFVYDWASGLSDSNV